MDDAMTLIWLSLAMLIGCYVSGLIPLCFNFSEEKLKKFSVFGAGLLLGTSLAVIIPEGVHVMYMNSQAEMMTSKSASADTAVSGVHTHSEHSGVETHTQIGVALVLGFLLMLLIDELGGGKHSHSISANVESDQGVTLRHKSTLTTGLVVHAAADGIALGAAASMQKMHVEFIVFAAIMLHKAPAALGLVSILLRDGMDKSRIRRHLAVFSSAAPILSVFTYFFLSQMGREAFHRMNGTGLTLLFSAGTFLYVSTVHVLPDLMNSKTSSKDGPLLQREHSGFTKCELLLVIAGTASPLLLSLGHHH